MTQPLGPTGPQNYPVPPGYPMIAEPLRLRGAPKAMAIVAIVLGSLGLMGVCGLPAYFTDFGQPNPIMDWLRQNKFLFTVHLVLILTGLVVAVFLLAGGIMCLRLRPAGRKILTGAAAVQLLVGLIGLAIGLLVTLPVYRFKAAQDPANIQWKAAVWGAYGGVCLGLPFLALYVAILYVFTRPEAIAQFELSPPPPPPGGPAGPGSH